MFRHRELNSGVRSVSYTDRVELPAVRLVSRAPRPVRLRARDSSFRRRSSVRPPLLVTPREKSTAGRKNVTTSAGAGRRRRPRGTPGAAPPRTARAPAPVSASPPLAANASAPPGSVDAGQAARQERAHGGDADRRADAARELVERGRDAEARPIDAVLHGEQQRQHRVPMPAPITMQRPAAIQRGESRVDQATGRRSRASSARCRRSPRCDSRACTVRRAPTIDMTTQPRNSGVSTWPASVAVPPQHAPGRTAG